MPDINNYFYGAADSERPGFTQPAGGWGGAPALPHNSRGATWEIGWGPWKAAAFALAAVAVAIAGVQISRHWSGDLGQNRLHLEEKRSDNQVAMTKDRYDADKSIAQSSATARIAEANNQAAATAKAEEQLVLARQHAEEERKAAEAARDRAYSDALAAERSRAEAAEQLRSQLAQQRASAPPPPAAPARPAPAAYQPPPAQLAMPYPPGGPFAQRPRGCVQMGPGWTRCYH